MAFLPVTKKEMLERGWERPDFVYISGDAYVDHPSFGAAIICRVLESHGYKVCFIPQPKNHSPFMKIPRNLLCANLFYFPRSEEHTSELQSPS